jgi:hypothetical protein
VIEVGIAIICTSLSSLRPLAKRYFPSLFSALSQYQQSHSFPSQQNPCSVRKTLNQSDDTALEDMTNRTVLCGKFEMHESDPTNLSGIGNNINTMKVTDNVIEDTGIQNLTVPENK